MVWAGEFIVILGGVLVGVLNGQVILPYSEINDNWMKRRKIAHRIPLVENKETIVEALNNRNFTVLQDQPSLINETNYAEVVVFESTGDPTKYISVVNVSNPTGKAKDKKVKSMLKFYPLQNANI